MECIWCFCLISFHTAVPHCLTVLTLRHVPHFMDNHKTLIILFIYLCLLAELYQRYSQLYTILHQWGSQTVSKIN